MALKLTVLTAQREELGSQSSIVFGVAGGRIGRASDNDWVLPDPERWLSAHHARVQFRDGAFVLIDTSTNGVYVNDAGIPIGRRSSYALRHGDILRFGTYQIVVTIDVETAVAAEAAEASTIKGLDRTRPDIGASLQVRDLLSATRPEGSERSLTEDTAILAFDSGQRAKPPDLTTAVNRQGRNTDRAVEHLGAMEAFCRGANINPKDLPVDSPARTLNLAGALLREMLVGLKGLALLQRETREQLRVDVGKEDLQQIALTGLPVEDLMLRLLMGHDRHEMDAVLWARDLLGSARRHDVATITALLNAFAEYVARLDPQVLGQDADANPKAMAARFRSLTEAGRGALPRLFVESFARAFAQVYLQSFPDSNRSG
jgi:predicted component of type VI protein secretion system